MTDEVRRVAEIVKQPRFGFSVSPYGQWLLYDQIESHGGDIMLVENFR